MWPHVRLSRQARSFKAVRRVVSLFLEVIKSEFVSSKSANMTRFSNGLFPTPREREKLEENGNLIQKFPSGGVSRLSPVASALAPYRQSASSFSLIEF